jgi:hypothetical protein
MRILKFISALVVVFLCFHILWSSVVVVAFRTIYSHRIFDITKISNVGEEWESFTSSFFGHMMRVAYGEKKPLVLFIGSSVTFGYSWQESVIYTKLVSESFPDWKVSNLSVIGVGMRAMTDFVTCAIRPGSRPSIIFVELPLVNSTASISAESSHAPRQCKNYVDGIPGYFYTIFARPHGMAWIPILWDGHAYEKTDANFKNSPLPPDYFLNEENFSKIKDKYLTEVRRFLLSVSLMGDKVFVYVSPILTSAISGAGGDQAAVEYQMKLTNEVCMEYKNITCLDSSVFSGRSELFYNLTHLNHRGHRVLAEWFKPYISQSGSVVPPPRPHLPTE